MNNTFKNQYLEEIALKNPLLRPIQISTELIPKTRISSKLNGSDFINGDAQIFRSSFLYRTPIINWNTNSINASFAIVTEYANLTNIVPHFDEFEVKEMSLSKTTFNFSSSFTKRSLLFGKPTVYNLLVTSLFNSEFSDSQLSFSGTVLLNLKRTRSTNLSMGIAVLISPTTKIPAFGLISYQHTFEKFNLELLASMPYRLALRKPLSPKSSLSFVNELTGSLAFYSISEKYFPTHSRLNTSEIKSGLTFEHRLGRKIVLGASAGAIYIISSRMSDSNNKYWDTSYFLESNNPLNSYLNLNFSVLPF